MTQKNKQLLLKDLCARLPYGVKATTTSNGWSDVYIVSGCNDDRIYLDCPVYDEGDDEWLIESVKPYLRPMSSMTEDEVKKYDGILSNYDVNNLFLALGFLNSIHIDYNGLIPKGLALEAPEGMYN